MCTLSWLIDAEEKSYQLFFNRDEQRTRAKALLPQLENIDNTQVLMPIDPDGQGTWISANEFGLSLCLLNNYQQVADYQPVKSRGLLVKALSSASHFDALSQALKAFELKEYAPFLLLAFQDASVISFQWSGAQLDEVRLSSPVSSSSVDFEHVVNTRLDNYPRHSLNAESLMQYHHQHYLNEKNHLSVCMHRKDAHTVSYSEITVDQQGVVFSYLPHAPCYASSEGKAVLNLHRVVNSII